ncbi:uncharacterized protein PpBr36_06498 [Pyricularia pennisetigena]|uniref:uncharacterized protein n=1 Tax=Pyricularia pennisetigena TaxID=1578925 RepID=UPI0011547E24|nr:uncharacterized protein PpBr36_06498 [Pyricularia pennisetigena]TLS22692.1 hypothetical protein PpBr36_06498 [Pyricularia pennisetigena]
MALGQREDANRNERRLRYGARIRFGRTLVVFSAARQGLERRCQVLGTLRALAAPDQVPPPPPGERFSHKERAPGRSAARMRETEAAAAGDSQAE